MNIFAYDKLTTSSRRTDDSGFLIVPGQIARTGIQDYLAHELGMGGDPMKVLHLYRPESEVFDADSMASFENRPVTLDHPKGEAVTADSHQ